MVHEPDLLAAPRGLIVAPAGCGKTHAIVSALQRHRSSKPILVLTHTNAGVAALRQRLRGVQVPRAAYRLTTIDGWAMRLVATFPMRSSCPTASTPREPNYRQIRENAALLLKSGHIARILAASYDRLFVDEYQDCSTRQHRMVAAAADCLPTLVLGDPLQAIFSFDRLDPLPDWADDICRVFPPISELSHPWRWRNVGNNELGDWLAVVRASLLAGRAIDLASAPNCVRWVQLRDDASDHATQLNAARCTNRTSQQSGLIIGDSKSEGSRHRIAKSVRGVVTVEPVDLRSLTDFAARLERCDGRELRVTLDFVRSLVTKVNPNGLLKRVEVLKNGSARNPPNEVEQAALNLCESPTLEAVANLLDACSRRPGGRVFRPEILRASLRALQLSQAGSGKVSLSESAIRIREEGRALGRRLPSVGIGSTLLLKGLEADHVVVLNAANLDANNLYVALTRGSRTITVCSRSTEVPLRGLGSQSRSNAESHSRETPTRPTPARRPRSK